MSAIISQPVPPSPGLSPAMAKLAQWSLSDSASSVHSRALRVASPHHADDELPPPSPRSAKFVEAERRGTAESYERLHRKADSKSDNDELEPPIRSKHGHKRSVSFVPPVIINPEEGGAAPPSVEREGSYPEVWVKSDPNSPADSVTTASSSKMEE